MGKVDWMKDTYAKLFSPITLHNGAVLQDRFVMAPMVAEGGLPDGNVSAEDIAYFERRNQVGDLLITGATAVSENGLGFTNPLMLTSDTHIPSFTKLAAVMQSNGSKAVVQLCHNGRRANIAHEKYQRVVGPSSVVFASEYTPEALTKAEIEAIIQDFGTATKRAIMAGFDGVEVHGANHYLLQQFFSAHTNVREDAWGGSIEKRMQFPLAVLREVKRVVAEYATDDFIVGYRISPEEVHGEVIGYTIDDALQLIEAIVSEGVDYVHVSLFGNAAGDIIGFKRFAQKGTATQPMNMLIKEQISGRTAQIVVGSINTADRALEALAYGDLVAMGEAALRDPDMRTKISTGNETLISMDISIRYEELALTPNLLAKRLE